MRGLYREKIIHRSWIALKKIRYKACHVNIANEILMYLRSTKKTDADLSLQEPLGIDKEGNEISMLDLLGSDGSNISEEVELKLEIKVLYNKLKNTLKKRELDIIKMRYGLEGSREMTQKEVGARLGISRSYVSRIEKKALGKLKKQFQL